MDKASRKRGREISRLEARAAAKTRKPSPKGRKAARGDGNGQRTANHG
nr:MAG TPA: hypothetical protein [Caudoviricetes sp.]